MRRALAAAAALASGRGRVPAAKWRCTVQQPRDSRRPPDSGRARTVLLCTRAPLWLNISMSPPLRRSPIMYIDEYIGGPAWGTTLALSAD